MTTGAPSDSAKDAMIDSAGRAAEQIVVKKAVDIATGDNGRESTSRTSRGRSRFHADRISFRAAKRELTALIRHKTVHNSGDAAKGKLGEAITREKLGDRIAGEQVTFEASDGTRSRPDFVTTDGDIVESKTGNASLTSGQAKLKSDVDAGREVTPVGKNAEKAGLRPEEPTKMRSRGIDRTC